MHTKHKQKNFSCPHCSATEIEFIAPGIGRCKYCGARIDLPKEEKQYDPNNPFDVLDSIFNKNNDHDPRADVIEQLYYPLSKREAFAVQQETFKQTKYIWFFSLISIVVTIAMFIVANISLCSKSAVVAVVVPLVIATISTIVALVINGRKTKATLVAVQQKRVDDISATLERNLYAPLTTAEIEKALSSTGKHRVLLISKRNAVQVLSCVICPILLLASLFVAPMAENNHIDSVVEGVCDRCGFDLHQDDFIFTLNDDGKGYTLTGVKGIFEDTGIDNSGFSATITLPSSHNGLPVTTIGAGAFSNKGNHYTLIIPDSIKVIEANAFAHTHLWEIDFETDSDWYLVEEGKWLTERTSLYPTPETFCKATFTLFGKYTWAKSPWSI